MTTLFNIFEVPPGADAEFVTWWRRTGAFIEERIGRIDAALHRSVAADARFRYVNVAAIDDPVAWRAAVSAPGFPGAGQPGIRHPGLYEVVRGDRAPAEPVVIAPYDDGDDGDVLAAWDRAPGDVLYRSLSPSADFPFVELSRPERQSERAASARGCHPALYEVVAR